jgi:hypothetical protein
MAKAAAMDIQTPNPGRCDCGAEDHAQAAKQQKRTSVTPPEKDAGRAENLNPGQIDRQGNRQQMRQQAVMGDITGECLGVEKLDRPSVCECACQQ